MRPRAAARTRKSRKRIPNFSASALSGMRRRSARAGNTARRKMHRGSRRPCPAAAALGGDTHRRDFAFRPLFYRAVRGSLSALLLQYRRRHHARVARAHHLIIEAALCCRCLPHLLERSPRAPVSAYINLAIVKAATARCIARQMKIAAGAQKKELSCIMGRQCSAVAPDGSIVLILMPGIVDQQHRQAARAAGNGGEHSKRARAPYRARS